MKGFLLSCGWMESRVKTVTWSLWQENTLKCVPPDRVLVVTGENSCPGPLAPGVQRVILPGNLGHWCHLISGERDSFLTGWSAHMLCGAMLAYAAELDFIFKEQDCLAFGPWVEALYSAAEGKQLVFGDFPDFVCAQSLFLVRHEFIPKFVTAWIQEGRENHQPNMPEHKMLRLSRISPGDYGTFSFGYDRRRPFDTSDPVFYLQHVTPDELEILKGANLITEETQGKQ